MLSIVRALLVRSMAVLVLGTALALGSAGATPHRAEAQLVSTVQSLPKGTIGLGLVGVEIGLIIPAIAGARDWWPYLVFPILGGAGGAVGGYFMDINTTSQPEISVAVMAIGMALLVPTIIGTLALTAYQPPTESSEADEDMEYEGQSDGVDAVQEDSSSAAPDDGGSGGGGGGGSQDEFGDSAQSSSGPSVQQRIQALTAGGPGLLRMHQGQLLLGVPLVASLPTFTAEEMERLNLRQRTDVNIPVVSATF